MKMGPKRDSVMHDSDMKHKILCKLLWLLSNTLKFIQFPFLSPKMNATKHLRDNFDKRYARQKLIFCKDILLRIKDFNIRLKFCKFQGATNASWNNGFKKLLRQYILNHVFNSKILMRNIIFQQYQYFLCR